jgi:hypothetical protein
MPANISDLCAQHAKLKSDRSTWDSWCQELANYICPRKSQITTQEHQPSDTGSRQLYDTTGVMANQTLGQGQMAYITPMEERWFSCEPPDDVQDDEAIAYYSKCGEIMAVSLATSNFYTEVHEMYLDRGGFGTSNLYVEESMTNRPGLVFDTVPVGSYSIAENDEKMVDTVFRDREMTAIQMFERWGEHVLPKEVKAALKKAEDRWKTFNVVHAVYPRTKRDSTKLDSANMPLASCWFMPQEKALLAEGGYESSPYLVSRYLRWNLKGGAGVYGWCPGFTALPDERQLNFLEMLMDGLAEVELFPRILMPSTLDGEYDLSAGGVTIYNPFQGGKPETWATGGNYQHGIERAEAKRQRINDAYHVDLFRMFAALGEHRMTAREVSERASEKLIQFSPTFARLTTELLTPLLDRVFRILNRQGRFPQPPPSVVAMDRIGPHIRPPRVVFKSRVALAIRSLQSSGFLNLVEAITPLMQADPTVRHIINIPSAGRGLARNFGVPEEWMRSEEEFNAIVGAEQQAMAQQQQAAMMNETVGTAAKLKPEQLEAVAKALGQQGA